MTGGHDVMVGGDTPEQDRPEGWLALVVAATVSREAENRLWLEVERAHDEGWSWRRLSAATGLSADTLRRTITRRRQAGEEACGEPKLHEGSPRLFDVGVSAG